MLFDNVPSFGKPSVYHAVIIIFLEFFAWGLLTVPMMALLHDTFEEQTFLINGMVQGIKGLLSFLSAPLLGALSDVWGRKLFLLITVFVTCCPIPIMCIHPGWFFALVSISGAFAVTFSIVFAYVADLTDETQRSSAYGLVSATFAASLVTSTPIGEYLARVYSPAAVVALATCIALLDLCFILVAVPESLPEKCRPSSWNAPLSWEQVDPFASLRKIGHDRVLLLFCLTVFLSYLPEAGEYSCIILYLPQVIGFSYQKVTAFIAVVGILAIVVQTALLTCMFQSFGNKATIVLGLSFEVIQLTLYAFGKSDLMIWLAGIFSALSSINYPALTSLVSYNADSEQQGLVQGLVTGIRGLCNGLGPLVFGVIFFVFGVDVDMTDVGTKVDNIDAKNTSTPPFAQDRILPGPPFLFGALLVVSAIFISLLIPDKKPATANKRKKKSRFEDNDSDQASELLTNNSNLNSSLHKNSRSNKGHRNSDDNELLLPHHRLLESETA